MSYRVEIDLSDKREIFDMLRGCHPREAEAICNCWLNEHPLTHEESQQIRNQVETINKLHSIIEVYECELKKIVGYLDERQTHFDSLCHGPNYSDYNYASFQAYWDVFCRVEKVLEEDKK